MPSSPCFFVTTGKGLEFIAKEELQDKFGLQNVEYLKRQETGKIFFRINHTQAASDSHQTDGWVQRLLQLQSIERLFILVPSPPLPRSLLHLRTKKSKSSFTAETFM
jgi:hypothetical protein